MQITTPGLVLRATKTGESDRVLSILTPKYGVVTAMAKGSLRLKSKLFSATGLFCYSEFTLFEGKTMYRVDEADVHEVFFGLHEDVEAMGLAMYLAEVASTLAPAGENADNMLRLLLNSLYLLSKGKRAPRFIKAVFELRALTLSGFMPDIVACAVCAKYEKSAFYFDVIQGGLLCESCAAARNLSCNLDAAALNAMRHIVLAEDARLFSFSIGAESLQYLSAVVGQYTLVCLDKPMKSLDFLQTVLN